MLKLLLFLAAAIALLTSALLYPRFTMDNARGERTLSWPTTPGRISQSRLEILEHRTQSTEYVDSIEYEYTVDGRVYRSRSIDLKIRNMNDRPTMRAFVDSYQAGQLVPVHYNPQNPADALLVPGPAPETAAPRLLAANILIAVGIGLLFLAWWTGKRTVSSPVLPL